MTTPSKRYNAFKDELLPGGYGPVVQGWTQRQAWRARYLLANWKQVTHLLLRTKRFGVNGKWWSRFDSMYGWPWRRIVRGVLLVKPLLENYRMMRARAGLGFIDGATYRILFGERGHVGFSSQAGEG